MNDTTYTPKTPLTIQAPNRETVKLLVDAQRATDPHEKMKVFDQAQQYARELYLQAVYDAQAARDALDTLRTETGR